MKVFSIVGVSQSGKTVTVEALVKELRHRGYSVGSVKDIHFEGFTLDQEGTNTHRHRTAGSQLVTARGLHETDIMFSSRLPLDKILSFYDHDFVILEGAYDFEGPSIIAACEEKEIDERRHELVFAVAGKISGRLKEYKGLPVINALEDTAWLVDMIEKIVPHWKGSGPGKGEHS